MNSTFCEVIWSNTIWIKDYRKTQAQMKSILRTFRFFMCIFQAIRDEVWNSWHFYYHVFFFAENACKTPDNWDGRCIVLQQCRPLYSLLQGTLTNDQRTFLRSSQCGREGSKPLVCCPNTFTEEDLPSNKHCGVQVSDKIVGGEDTSINELPWYVMPSIN